MLVCCLPTQKIRGGSVGRLFIIFFLIVEVGPSVGFFFLNFLNQTLDVVHNVEELVYMTFVNFNIFSDTGIIHISEKNQMHCMCR